MVFALGTVYNTIRQATLNSKWQLKKESKDILSKSERNERANWSSEEWMKQNFKDQLENDKEASKRTDIDNKVMSGGTLSPEEEKYLEQKDPAAYQKYKQTKLEKKAFEERLKKCKTKEEVEKLKVEKLGSILSSFKKIENNPYISKSEKFKKAKEMIAQTKNLTDAEAKFKRTLEYDELPTQAQKDNERIDESVDKLKQLQDEVEDISEVNKEEVDIPLNDHIDDKKLDIPYKERIDDADKLSNPFKDDHVSFNMDKNNKKSVGEKIDYFV